jgi:hypothetical protein
LDKVLPDLGHPQACRKLRHQVDGQPGHVEFSGSCDQAVQAHHAGTHRNREQQLPMLRDLNGAGTSEQPIDIARPDGSA